MNPVIPTVALVLSLAPRPSCMCMPSLLSLPVIVTYLLSQCLSLSPRLVYRVAFPSVVYDSECRFLVPSCVGLVMSRCYRCSLSPPVALLFLISYNRRHAPAVVPTLYSSRSVSWCLLSQLRSSIVIEASRLFSCMPIFSSPSLLSSPVPSPSTYPLDVALDLLLYPPEYPLHDVLRLHELALDHVSFLRALYDSGFLVAQTPECVAESNDGLTSSSVNTIVNT
ncbi:hypothetical protein C8Q74DRAFT_127200 [Fomes fomentarius]|nr:hypothetical protein C8Q74DRAFT_127200 [Fomes fomentarius]